MTDRRRPSSPVQPAGWVVLFVGACALLGALLLNWRELLVLAVGCGLILLLSLAFVIGRSEIRLERTLPQDRVAVGDVALVELRAENTGTVRTSRQIISEAIDGAPVPVPLPPLAPGAARTVSWRPPTDRRGRYRLGPARITKADPCRLMQREVGQTGFDELWVRPRVRNLPAFAGGMTKDVDGPTFDHSPAGDVAFHAVRPYRVGDDARHVHWMATARAGEMMVRHYVDNRQPHVSVVLDTAEQSWASMADFDAALDIVATVAVATIEDAHPVSVRAGANLVMGTGRRSTIERLLDDLTLVATDDTFDLGSTLGPTITSERATTVAVVVTGTRQTVDRVRGPILHLGRSTAVVVVQVGRDPNHDFGMVASRSVRYVEASDVDVFTDAVRERVLR